MKWTWLKLYILILLMVVMMTACGNVPQANAPVVTATDTAQPMASPTPFTGGEPAAPPRIANMEEAANAFSAGAAFLETRASEKYSVEERSQPGVLEYSIQLAGAETLIWSYYWCAADAEILAKNFSQIDVQFELNGETIPLDQFVIVETQSEGRPCRMIYTALSEWTSGTHQLTTTVLFKSDLNDGMGEYPAGEYIADYSVMVP